MSSSNSTNSTEVARLGQYDTVYYQVYKQIDYIKKFKLTSELNNKEKVKFCLRNSKCVLNLNEF